MNPQHRNRGSPKPLKSPPKASPSASILLISPSNEILLLRRVKKSSSFASAHVFPGGHIDPEDGPLPPEDDVRLHEDNTTYRMGAIRECFEESGILLARNRENQLMLLQLTEEQRHHGRNAVHNKKMRFEDLVHSHGGVPDIESLHPFTRWLTPANISKRFSTQMYLYFLPIAHPGLPHILQIPTSDGGVEHTEAEFLPAAEWLSRAQADRIILFPPQLFLLSLVADFLKPHTLAGAETLQRDVLQSQRNALLEFVKTGDPPWGEMCISPSTLKKEGSLLIMGLDKPGPELEGTGRKGDAERVVWAQLKSKEATSGLRVGWRRDIEPEGLYDEEKKEYDEIQRKERESGDRDEGLERALRGRKENL
ncbi:MAG: hypothetical protein Q9216_001966 [Gyalolechia sp. 2 TL-2023]